MATGSVQWFDEARGWGFIRSDSGNDLLYVRFAWICGRDERTLKPGESVEYEAFKGPLGLRAMKVMPLNPIPVSDNTALLLRDRARSILFPPKPERKSGFFRAVLCGVF